MLRRSGVLLGYCVFLLLVVEGAMRLGGIALMLRHKWRAHAATSDASFRILAIGESTTFGLGVAPEAAYPAQLERLLNEHAKQKFIVVNTGVPGQTSSSILRSIRSQMFEYRPQIVVAQFGVNDGNEALNDLSSRIWFGFHVPRFIASLRLFRLASVMRDYFRATRSNENGAWLFFDPAQRRADGRWVSNSYYYRQLELNYRDVIDVIESFGARVVMLSYLRSDEPIRKVLQRIARDTDITYVELYSDETNVDTLFTEDRFHPNEQGHRLIASKIHAVLDRDGLVPQSIVMGRPDAAPPR